MEKVAVLPVPDCAWAMTSYPKQKRIGQQKELYHDFRYEVTKTKTF